MNGELPRVSANRGVLSEGERELVGQVEAACTRNHADSAAAAVAVDEYNPDHFVGVPPGLQLDLDQIGIYEAATDSSFLQAIGEISYLLGSRLVSCQVLQDLKARVLLAVAGAEDAAAIPDGARAAVIDAYDRSPFEARRGPSGAIGVSAETTADWAAEADVWAMPVILDGEVRIVAGPIAAEVKLGLLSRSAFDSERCLSIRLDDKEPWGSDVQVVGSDPASVTRARLAADTVHVLYALGMFAELIRLTIDHVQSRVQFGRPLSAFQTIQFKLADAQMELDSASLAAREALAAIRDRNPFAEQAALSANAVTLGTLRNLAPDLCQFHGGTGTIEGHPTHLIYRRTKAHEARLGSADARRERLGQLLYDARGGRLLPPTLEEVWG